MPYTAEWRARRRSWAARLTSERTVEVDQAIGDPVDVMHALDVRPARRADLSPERRLLDQRAQRGGERLPGRGHDRDADAVALGAALDHVLLQVGDDRLAERHRLEREHAVPARVE